MGNLFLERARDSDWGYCSAPGFCAKCNLRFRREIIDPIEEVYGDVSAEFRELEFPEFIRLPGWREHLRSDLRTLPIREFKLLEFWEDHLRMAFFFLRDRGMESEILEHWLGTFADDVQFADTVVFYFIRPRHRGTDIAARWIDRAITLAVATRHESLVESLIWTVGSNLAAYPALREIAGSLQGRSPLILRAMREAAGWKPADSGK